MLTEPVKSVAIRTDVRLAEVAWFDDLCGGDTQYLGVLDQERRSNYNHCHKIMLTAEQMGFRYACRGADYTIDDGSAAVGNCHILIQTVPCPNPSS